MPCYDPDCHTPRSSNRTAELTRLRKKLDHVTNLLCWLCSNSEPSALEFNTPLQEWWAAHQAADAERAVREEKEAREKEVQHLLMHAATLSPEELRRKLES
jgi:hypothetical protein